MGGEGGPADWPPIGTPPPSPPSPRAPALGGSPPAGARGGAAGGPADPPAEAPGAAAVQEPRAAGQEPPAAGQEEAVPAPAAAAPADTPQWEPPPLMELQGPAGRPQPPLGAEPVSAAPALGPARRGAAEAAAGPPAPPEGLGCPAPAAAPAAAELASPAAAAPAERGENAPPQPAAHRQPEGGEPPPPAEGAAGGPPPADSQGLLHGAEPEPEVPLSAPAPALGLLQGAPEANGVPQGGAAPLAALVPAPAPEPQPAAAQHTAPAPETADPETAAALQPQTAAETPASILRRISEGDDDAAGSEPPEPPPRQGAAEREAALAALRYGLAAAVAPAPPGEKDDAEDTPPETAEDPGLEQAPAAPPKARAPPSAAALHWGLRHAGERHPGFDYLGRPAELLLERSFSDAEWRLRFHGTQRNGWRLLPSGGGPEGVGAELRWSDDARGLRTATELRDPKVAGKKEHTAAQHVAYATRALGDGTARLRCSTWLRHDSPLSAPAFEVHGEVKTAQFTAAGGLRLGRAVAEGGGAGRSAAAELSGVAAAAPGAWVGARLRLPAGAAEAGLCLQRCGAEGTVRCQWPWKCIASVLSPPAAVGPVRLRGAARLAAAPGNSLEWVAVGEVAGGGGGPALKLRFGSDRRPALALTATGGSGWTCGVSLTAPAAGCSRPALGLSLVKGEPPLPL